MPLSTRTASTEHDAERFLCALCASAHVPVLHEHTRLQPGFGTIFTVRVRFGTPEKFQVRVRLWFGPFQILRVRLRSMLTFQSSGSVRYPLKAHGTQEKCSYFYKSMKILQFLIENLHFSKIFRERLGKWGNMHLYGVREGGGTPRRQSNLLKS